MRWRLAAATHTHTLAHTHALSHAHAYTHTHSLSRHQANSPNSLEEGDDALEIRRQVRLRLALEFQDHAGGIALPARKQVTSQVDLPQIQQVTRRSAFFERQ